MVRTLLSPSRHSSPICFPLSKFHARSEPSIEQVMTCCPSSRYITSEIGLVCPSNFWQGIIVNVSVVLMFDEENFEAGWNRGWTLGVSLVKR